MKATLLVVLVLLVALTAAKPDRYLRQVRNADVCNKGDFLRSGRCWRPCPKGYSQQFNNWARCQKNCAVKEVSKKGRCYTRRCIKGWRAAGGKCYAIACPRGYVHKSVTECWRPCPKPYVARGHKCVNTGAKPGQCDSYTRPSTKRSSRPFIVYTQKTIPRSWYWPKCRFGWDMFPVRRCWGPCKKGYLRKGKYCKNKDCYNKNKQYKREGPNHPTICPKGTVFLKKGLCWLRCPKGWSHQWNHLFRCQKNCKVGEKHNKGVCYTRRCVKGYRAAKGRCYAIACPRGFVHKSVTECWRPCHKPYVARGHKCVNTGAKPGQCDSYTRPSTGRAHRPFIVYRPPTRPKATKKPVCVGGWRMEHGKCRKLCRSGYTIIKGDCVLTKCIGI